jgi:hypothetical protein
MQCGKRRHASDHKTQRRPVSPSQDQQLHQRSAWTETLIEKGDLLVQHGGLSVVAEVATVHGVLQRRHGVFRGIGKNGKRHEAQSQLARECEQRFEHVQTPDSRHHDPGYEVLSGYCHRRADDTREHDAIEERRLPSTQAEYSPDVSHEQLLSRADATGKQVSCRALDAPPHCARTVRRQRTKSMGNFEARDGVTHSALIVRGRLVWQHNNEINVRTIRESTFRRTAEKNQTDGREADLSAFLYDLVHVNLDALWKRMAPCVDHCTRAHT